MTENEPKSRKLWFITRPQRDPTFHPEALRALDSATEHFSLKWKGNRELQKEYEKELINVGLKRSHVSRDGSGGRTWAAMLRTFSYVYLDTDGYLRLTKVGREILEGKNERENIIKQILTLQIPNAYFLDSSFRPQYESGFRIFPVRFLLKLVNQEALDYRLTKEEIIYYAMRAKRNEDLNEVTLDILRNRRNNGELLGKTVNEIETDYEHRSRSDSSARDFLEAHSDVAHTFMLLSEYTGLVSYVRGNSYLEVPWNQRVNTSKVLEAYDNQYPFRDESRYSSLDLLAQANGLSFGSFKLSTYGNVKPISNQQKKLAKARAVLSEYPNSAQMGFSEIVHILKGYFPEEQAKKLAEELEASEQVTYDDAFAHRYLHETNNLQFEDDTGKVLEAIGFDVIMRPEPVRKDTTKIEILARYSKDEYCIFDAKNYAGVFNLSSNMRSIMQSEYIPNYDNYEGGTLTHFGYVTSNKFGNPKFLEVITEKANRIIGRDVTGILVSASALLGYLDYCELNDISKKERLDCFVNSIQNKGYSTYQDILAAGAA
ncbi:MAG: AlwI family type II restriction endonuclease [Clostridium lundense]|nr:AlwI family type II restriction endonuclease [Clostridium lundense]MBE6515662.1 AlwI family type II restriction endonuclease [Methanocorpusculum parvum]